MSSPVLFAHPSSNFTEICRLFFEIGIHHLPVLTKRGKLVGMISATDVLRTFAYQIPLLEKKDVESINQTFQVAEIMTPMPLHVIGPDDTVMSAANRFSRFKIHALPVVEKEELVGIITANDLLESLASSEERLRFV